MHQQQEGPRNQEIRETKAEAFISQSAADGRNGNEVLVEAAGKEEDNAADSRTPERWWLRKRLMQGS